MQIKISKAKLIVTIIAAVSAIIVLLGALFFVPDNNINSCVRIYTSIGYGSGMIYNIDNNEVLIATADHVLEGFNENSYIEFADGAKAHGYICSEDDINDIGILSIPVMNIPEESLHNIKQVYITRDVLASEPEYLEDDYLDECIMYDLFPKDGIIVFVDGNIMSMNEYIYDFDRHMLHGISTQVTEGMSGSPIFAKDGHLLGMLLGGNDKGDFVGITYYNLVNR